jgi:phosphatidylglycerol---prolipoprotein diacylglyceryl transferase
MYPLIELGPFRLGSGGLLLVVALLLAMHWFGRTARRRGGSPLEAAADRCVYPVLLGALLGARLWYGLFNWDLYGRSPELFLAFRVTDLAWPGAILGGLLGGGIWCRLRQLDTAALADSAALALPVPQAIASAGLLLSGEAFGVPASLPWAVPLLGTSRHPTQLYYALAALVTFWALRRLSAWAPLDGALLAGWLTMQGLMLLLFEPLRADSLLLPGGIRAAQVVGLGLLLATQLWARRLQPAISTLARS